MEQSVGRQRHRRAHHDAHVPPLAAPVAGPPTALHHQRYFLLGGRGARFEQSGERLPTGGSAQTAVVHRLSLLQDGSQYGDDAVGADPEE